MAAEQCIEDVTEGVGDRLRDAAHTARVALEESAREGVEAARETARKACATIRAARAKGSAMHEDVRGRTVGDIEDGIVGVIRKNPMSAFAVAAGAGLLAGILLRRK
jgi:ElaB/YqjD/DUF883 family membrane-anchored ribosome-binding protein